MAATRRIIVYHVPLVLYAGVVIALSSIPNLNPPPIRLLATDKVLHFIEYGVFSYLAFRSFSHLGNRIALNRALWLAAIFICCFAIIDEYYQRFIPGRHFDIYDIITDVGGAILVLLLLWMRKKRSAENTAQ